MDADIERQEYVLFPSCLADMPHLCLFRNPQEGLSCVSNHKNSSSLSLSKIQNGKHPAFSMAEPSE